ncbi:MAG: hypothetical protein ACT4NY_26250 [Pseudonocardiales bacterium]
MTWPWPRPRELFRPLAFGLLFWPAGGFAVLLAIVPAFLLAVGSARMVRLTQLILMITGTGRVNFIQLLEDAYQRQVLRQAGTLYQFRHAELQEHLAKIHRQRT